MLGRCDLETLGRRKSHKWRAHPADVLPAFERSLPWLDALLARLLGERQPGVACVPPEASFLAWLDCRALGLGEDPAAEFLARGRVALSAGPGFGTQGRGFARLNMGTSPELIAEAVRRMPAAAPPGEAESATGSSP
jgi:cysteine-S-conjugate beta-lyase